MATNKSLLSRERLKDSASMVSHNGEMLGDIKSVDYLLGFIIKDLRENDLGLTQKEFAELIELKQPQLSLIEKGEYPLRMNQFIKICLDSSVNPMALWAKFLDKFRICPDMPPMRIAEYSSFATKAEMDILQKRDEHLKEQQEQFKKRRANFSRHRQQVA